MRPSFLKIRFPQSLLKLQNSEFHDLHALHNLHTASPVQYHSSLGAGIENGKDGAEASACLRRMAAVNALGSAAVDGCSWLGLARRRRRQL